MTRIYTCPVNDFECPYYMDGLCTIGNPVEECDDYYYYLGSEETDETDEMEDDDE